MLPYIEKNFNITYAKVSILFVCTFLGYVVAAATAGTLARKVGFGHAMLISTMVELIGVSVMLTRSMCMSLKSRFLKLCGEGGEPLPAIKTGRTGRTLPR